MPEVECPNGCDEGWTQQEEIGEDYLVEVECEVCHGDAEAEIDRLRACEDTTPPAEGERHTAEQLWHHLLDASSHRRMYVLNQFLEAQDDANRCFLENHEGRLESYDPHYGFDG